jgi:single-stranded DNA-binding protein
MHFTLASGNIGKDPVAVGTGDNAGCRFSVACDDYYKGESQTYWYQVVVFGAQAKFLLEHAHKGDHVTVRGRMRDNKVEDKVYTSLVADDVKLVNRAKKDGDVPF